MRYLLTVVFLFLAGCEKSWNCEDYGVALNEQASVLRSINELPDSRIQEICGQGKVGCFKGGHLYYRMSDTYTLRHELCHVMHGPQHTVQYHQKLIQSKN